MRGAGLELEAALMSPAARSLSTSDRGPGQAEIPEGRMVDEGSEAFEARRVAAALKRSKPYEQRVRSTNRAQPRDREPRCDWSLRAWRRCARGVTSRWRASPRAPRRSPGWTGLAPGTPAPLARARLRRSSAGGATRRRPRSASADCRAVATCCTPLRAEPITTARSSALPARSATPRAPNATRYPTSASSPGASSATTAGAGRRRDSRCTVSATVRSAGRPMTTRSGRSRVATLTTSRPECVSATTSTPWACNTEMTPRRASASSSATIARSPITESSVSCTRPPPEAGSA